MNRHQCMEGVSFEAARFKPNPVTLANKSREMLKEGVVASQFIESIRGNEKDVPPAE